MNKLEKLLLETLSFYEPLTVEKLLLELDENELKQIKHLTMEDLINTLNKFKKKYMIVSKGKGHNQTYLRVNPRDISFFKKIYLKFF